ncbi:MAG: RNA polymerase sigma factor [Ruminococcus sp.]
MRKNQNKLNASKLAKYVARAQNGDRKSMERIVDETSGYVYYYCLTLLCSEDEANDAVQEIYLTVLKKLGTLENPKAFLGWLKTITSNHCKNRLARNKIYPSLDDEVLFENAEETDVQLIPQKQIEAQELKNAVVSAVRNLPVFQRECVMMYYYNEMSVSQIAGILEIKEGTVKSRLYNARKSIKSELERLGFSENTLGGFSSLAFVAYSLMSDSEKLYCPISLSALSKSGAVAGVVKAAAKTSLGIKAVSGIAAAGVLVTGGIIAHNVKQNAPVRESSVSQISESTATLTQPTTQHKWTAEELYYAHGYTDEERRTEIEFNPSLPLNSEQNKDYVYDRMNNSIDYFNTLQATCYYSDEKSAYYVSYCIQQGDNRKSKMLTYNGDGVPVSYYAFDGAYSKDFSFGNDASLIDSKNKEFNSDIAEEIRGKRSEKFAEELNKSDENRLIGKNYYSPEDFELDPNALLATKERYRYSEDDGCYVFESRSHTGLLPIAYEQYFPQEYAFNFLRDFDSWQIDRIDTVAGRECFAISGSADGEKGYTFEMSVDKETGSLLSFKAEGGINVELITTEFTVDSTLDLSIFDDLSKL